MAPTNAPMPAVSGCTCLRIRKAGRLVTQIYDRHLASVGLTITQFGLLAHLRSPGGIEMGVLAARLSMDPTTLTRNLRPLQRRGLVALAVDPEDRRARLVRLSGSGRLALAAARPAWEAAQKQIVDRLGGAALSALHAQLDSAIDRLAPERRQLPEKKKPRQRPS